MDEDFIIDIINEYIVFYKNNGDSDLESLFDNIDIKDETSTNYPLEQFYEAQCIFKKNEENGKSELNDVYDVGEMQFEPEIIYGINRNKILYKVSPSLFALLIEIVSLKKEYETDNFEIIILRTQ